MIMIIMIIVIVTLIVMIIIRRASDITTRVAKFLINVHFQPYTPARAVRALFAHAHTCTRLPTYAFVVFVYFGSVILRLKKRKSSIAHEKFMRIGLS